MPFWMFLSAWENRWLVWTSPIAPTTIPAFPKKPPGIPFVIFAILLCFCGLTEPRYHRISCFQIPGKAVSAIVRFWQVLAGFLPLFFGTSSVVLRYLFGKKMFFPNKYRTNIGQHPKKKDSIFSFWTGHIIKYYRSYIYSIRKGCTIMRRKYKSRGVIFTMFCEK